MYKKIYMCQNHGQYRHFAYNPLILESEAKHFSLIALDSQRSGFLENQEQNLINKSLELYQTGPKVGLFSQIASWILVRIVPFFSPYSSETTRYLLFESESAFKVNSTTMKQVASHTRIQNFRSPALQITNSVVLPKLGRTQKYFSLILPWLEMLYSLILPWLEMPNSLNLP